MRTALIAAVMDYYALKTRWARFTMAERARLSDTAKRLAAPPGLANWPPCAGAPDVCPLLRLSHSPARSRRA